MYQWLTAVGGVSDIRAGERYDLRVGQWTAIADMNHGKRFASSASIEGHAAVAHCCGRSE